MFIAGDETKITDYAIKLAGCFGTPAQPNFTYYVIMLVWYCAHCTWIWQNVFLAPVLKGLAAWPTLHLINDITYSFNRSCQTADVHENKTICRPSNIKGKVFPYSLPSVIGPGADPGVQAVSPQVTWSESRHRPESRLPLLSARPAVSSVAFIRWRYL